MTRLLCLFTIVSFSIAQMAVTGETATDIATSGDDTFSSIYTRVTLYDEALWNVTTNLQDGGINVEEAWYTFNVPANVEVTLGIQPEAYGNVWGLHRPSVNMFLDVPREHSTINGIGISVSAFSVDVSATAGNEGYWSVRSAHKMQHFGLDIHTGLSTNSNSLMLIDATIGGKGFVTSLEYDLSEETSGDYWVRSVITPGVAKGAFATVAYNSNKDMLYGVGYRVSENAFITSELSADDTRIRVSYSFK